MRDHRSMSDVQSHWALRPAIELDAPWIADLRAVVLRADLERLGRFDPIRVRQRFLSAFESAFEPALTKVVLVDGREVGSIAVRPDANTLCPHRRPAAWFHPGWRAA
jgi:hypothetical protein